MPVKTKTNQKKDFVGVSERDCFETPKYATKLLIPFIPASVSTVWECAAGSERMANVLRNAGYAVHSTDLKTGVNYLEQDNSHGAQAEITNPPFSLKEEFIRTAIRHNVPFAFLIPFDMNQWMWDFFKNFGCQGIVPRRRINFITPRTLTRIHEGEVWKAYLRDEFKDTYKNLETFKKALPQTWEATLRISEDYHNYKNVDDAPQELLHKYSSSDFHSFWLTRGFNLPEQLAFVDLSLEEIKNNI